MENVLPWLFLFAAVIWVCLDAKGRGTKNWYWWGIGTFLLFIVVFTIYLAKRPADKSAPLQKMTGYSFFKSATITWTLVMLVLALTFALFFATPQPAELAQFGDIALAAGLFALFFLWFFPTVVFGVIALVLRPKETVEKTAVKQPASEQVQVEGGKEILTQIEKLAELKDKGILTEAEFQEKKRELLKKV